MHSYQHTKHC